MAASSFQSWIDESSALTSSYWVAIYYRKICLPGSDIGGSGRTALLAQPAALHPRERPVLLEHAAHFHVLPQHVVHVLDGGAAAAGDALAAFAVNHVVVGALRGGH